MRPFILTAFAASVLLLSQGATLAEIKIVVDHNDNDAATAAFKFKNVPAPSKTDAATKASFTLVDGERDDNSGSLDQLHDGKTPTEADEPDSNFFFNAGTEGGRIQIDLGKTTDVKHVNTYSWHPSTRGPQVYKLYGSDGQGDNFKAQPKKGTDPEKAGWKLIASVDTRPKQGEGGGQYGVGISDSDGKIGKFRYLLFDVQRTETDDDFGNTFYSEIDVIDDGTAQSAGASPADAPVGAGRFTLSSPDGSCEITIDTTGAPELNDWAEKKLGPVLAAWYPKIVAMLPSEGYNAPKSFQVIIAPGNGVAATGGTRVTANSAWLKKELDGEAVGSLVHEEVHVVQQYRGGRNNPDYHRAPGWLVEGIPDYIRWFKYEPQSHGADAQFFRRRRNLDLKYDGKYRVSANFLNYVFEKYDKDGTLLTSVNAACRQGKYADDLWKTSTGKTLDQLNDEWKSALTSEIAVENAANTLTDAEKAEGWKLLFDGKDFAGWHNFKREGVRSGWQVKDGVLICVDPHDAGDIVTADQFDWFELQLDYNISVAGNSGIMYHVTDAGGAVWATGPEFQLEDNKEARDPVRCGWLYALYQPPEDPKTGKTLDATKPVGEWNHVRLLISPSKCEHEINGVKYFEYVLGSDDFKARVAKSKFARMPGFAQSEKGYIALQGDHGQVSFRNIKIRPITSSQ
jgi:hypothetical protein